eukprot:2512020-Lingulodinium_polyedra.AAC.1
MSWHRSRMRWMTFSSKAPCILAPSMDQTVRMSQPWRNGAGGGSCPPDMAAAAFMRPRWIAATA